jgi:hypothetical protein
VHNRGIGSADFSHVKKTFANACAREAQSQYHSEPQAKNLLPGIEKPAHATATFPSTFSLVDVLPRIASADEASGMSVAFGRTNHRKEAAAVAKQKHSGREDAFFRSWTSHDGSYSIGVNVGASAKLAGDDDEMQRLAEHEAAHARHLDGGAHERQAMREIGYRPRPLDVAEAKPRGRSSDGLKQPTLHRQIRAVRTIRDLLLASEHCPLTGEFYTPGAFALWRELDAAFKTLESLNAENAGAPANSPVPE